jgi:hypothetical protein
MMVWRQQRAAEGALKEAGELWVGLEKSGTVSGQLELETCTGKPGARWLLLSTALTAMTWPATVMVIVMVVTTE